MDKITVWTKQHKSVAEELEASGRYVAKKENISKDLDEHAHLVLEVYDWLVKHSPDASHKPKDAQYPIWVSFAHEATMLLSEDAVILELAIDPTMVTMVNINKWGTILNYSYIPADEQDAREHRQMLAQYGVSDAKAYMSQFYPQIKRKITDSWSRLFDDSVLLGSKQCYGNIWEIKKEWVIKIIR